MADDLREREPTRDQGDNPPENGIRSDIGGTGGSGGGVAAGNESVSGGTAVRRADARMTPAESSSSGEAPPDPLDDVDHPTADV